MFLHPQQHHLNHHHHMTRVSPPMDATSLARHGKRKAVDAPEGNERLSKRLSLLKLENGNTRLYVPVEGAPSALSEARTDAAPDSAATAAPVSATAAAAAAAAAPARPLSDDDSMQMDDTKYKVYIYDIDKELASDDDDEATTAPGARVRATQTTNAGDGSVVLLPDLDKHLRSVARDAALQQAAAAAAAPPKLTVPPPVRVNEDGELAGMQLVLYHDPSSLSVPREQDSVRMAILDARARIRARQREEQEEEEERLRAAQSIDDGAMADDDDDTMAGTPMSVTPLSATPRAMTPMPVPVLPVGGGDDDDDDDAMELD